MIKRKHLSMVLIMLLLVGFIGRVSSQEADFDFKAESALLVDATTGEVIFEKNMHEIVYPASITKIMTLLLCMEALESGKISMEDEVVISDRAAAMGGSQIFLSPGNVVTVEDLLIGISVGSGNDASVAIAEHLAGSLEGFVDMMNQRASQLGMNNTWFENACGLHVEGHHSTAYDIMLMSRALLEYPQVHEWFTIWMDEEFLKGKISEEGVFLSNTNRMVRYYSGCDGLKTGYTSPAGHCVSATAQRDNTRFISIIMNAPDSKTRFAEAQTLLDYAFANYKTVHIAEKNDVMAKVQLEKGTDTHVNLVLAEKVGILLKKTDEQDFKTEIKITHSLEAPIEIGEKLGKLVVLGNGKEAVKEDLLAEKEVPRASIFQIYKRILSKWVQFGR
ncbi:D-alanyl-D-alanine carboxypeptidase family protein [Candidatus Contubernalis alkaliaceticus]|uniref:D-alanyl-D-alanine carboxypeptidase family protein n=1 Tax=Candidatus Contubernalis alkaliaceticus TaxID=338645 RepID=UPI001F4BF39D|nr:D-alanyl-D-alanine carboxypeptidase family protein [Candidatus Contubernalis alkalaceticus]UNC92524.1 D-alanyl-D-alanine carboxypeptidase [Candidatus Contubernalis alkalaceticus]